MHSLSTTNLTKRFGHETAVDSVTLTLEPGRIYGLLGPNGSGKSTLMKLAAGLVHLTSGQIRVLGEPVGAKTRAHVAYMPTEFYFYPYMTVRQVGAFHADFYRDFSVPRFEELTARMGLGMGMRVPALSTGMAAKLKLAATASRGARLIMLDEPAGGIDLVARDAVLAAIIELADENNTVLISSHLIDVLESLLDDVILLKQGRIVMQGSAETLRAKAGKSIVDIYREVFAS